MNTNIKISLTDEERMLVSTWSGLRGPISRKDLTKLVHGLIEGIKDGTLRPIGEEAQLTADPTPERTTEDEAEAIRDRSVRKFVPSRGDEDYLYSGEDPELAAACSSVLDGLDFIQQYTWTALERNRQ